MSANQILADQVRDLGMDYVGRVLDGSRQPAPFVERILREGITDAEECVARASWLLFELTSRHGPVSMQLATRGVMFTSGEHTALVDWLNLRDAYDDALRAEVFGQLFPATVYPAIY